MTYFRLQNHHGEQIGSRAYFELVAARGAAKRLAGKWRKSNAHRGSSIKIVEIDSGAIYGGARTVEWVEA